MKTPSDIALITEMIEDFGELASSWTFPLCVAYLIECCNGEHSTEEERQRAAQKRLKETKAKLIPRLEEQK